MTHLIQVNELTKQYRNHKVLEDIHFTVNKNEIIGLVGENGAGKTTLLKILATIIPPTKGQISYDGKSMKKNVKNIRKGIGYVPQEISVWEDFSVKENMLFFAKLAWKRRTKEQCRQICLDMKLTQWEEKVHTLSGGMKRKLNLAISLLNDPDILLLDEPTVGIDLKSKTEIMDYLKRYVRENNKMILYTSHDMDEITSLCDRVLVIGADPFYRDVLIERGITVEVL